jgi:peptidoglycan/xylan/chitin deacetylase (PgdA/CDA1 family)
MTMILPIELKVAEWKYAKQWVYSATYDEGLSDLYRFVIPCHDEYGIPGHVEIVSGHIGNIRNLGQSSYNGMKHMDAGEIRDVMRRGWGVGCHSFSHIMVMDDPHQELLVAKQILEEAIGRRVTVYTAPGNNLNLTPEVIEKAKEYGFIAGMSITDDINLPGGDDLFWINRPPLHEKFSDLYDSAFDAYKRISQAKKNMGWIVDYLHCPLEKAVHDYKDCTAAHHRQRLEAIAEQGRYDCWFANPDDVVDYRYMRKYTKLVKGKSEGEYYVVTEGLPAQVMNRELTFILKSPYIPEAVKVFVDGTEICTYPALSKYILFTAKVADNTRIKVTEVME